MNENNPSLSGSLILSLTNDMPSGHYWCNQVYTNPTAPGVLVNGAVEVIIVTEPQSWHKRMRRMVYGRHWSCPLTRLVSDPKQFWKLCRIPEPPKELFL